VFDYDNVHGKPMLTQNREVGSAEGIEPLTVLMSRRIQVITFRGFPVMIDHPLIA